MGGAGPPCAGAKGCGLGDVKMVCRDTNVYSFVNSKEEKEHPLLKLGIKKAPRPKGAVPLCRGRKEMRIPRSSAAAAPPVQSGRKSGSEQRPPARVSCPSGAVRPSALAARPGPASADRWGEAFCLDLSIFMFP